MREKKYRVKLRRGRIFRFFKGVVKKFKTEPTILNLNEEEMQDRAIFVANHSGASGPFTFELYFPKYFIPWGTHEMCGNYKMRWNYLYHTFYRQKLKYSKLKSFLLATSFGLISKIFYNSTGLIGTYRDARLRRTFEKSFSVLDNNKSILIFPENSSNGYYDKPSEYYEGFVKLSKLYFKKTNIDLPVYNVYYSKKLNKIVIDKPLKINEMLQSGLTEGEVSQHFLNNAYKMFESINVSANNQN